MTMLKPKLLASRTPDSAQSPTTPVVVGPHSPPQALVNAVKLATFAPAPKRSPGRPRKVTATEVANHRFEARGANLAAFKCRDPEVVLSGPAGTGKSRAALEKLHQMALRNPGMRGLIMRKTAVSLPSSALKTWREDVIKLALLDGSVSFHGGGPQDTPQYRYDNGSTINIGGMDKPTRIMSTEYDVIYVQEATELAEDEWEMASSRLRNGRISFQQMLADCNPDHPTHWLLQRAERGQTSMLNSRHEDNPRYFNADGTMTEQGIAYMARLDALTGVRYHRLRQGLWVAASGVIFEGFDRATHLVDRFEPPRSWNRYWTIDFGFTHPFVWQEWVEDPDGRLYLYREIYKTRTLVEDHARKVLEITKDSPRPRKVICDHDIEDRMTFEKHARVRTVAATKTVSTGIEAVQARFKMQADGKPRIYVMKNAVVERDKLLVEAKAPTSTETEIPGYIWNEAKDAPVKERDDGCDTMRYMVADRDLNGGPTKVRFG